MRTFAYCCATPESSVEAQLNLIRANPASADPSLRVEPPDQGAVPWCERDVGRMLLAELHPGDRIILATLGAIFTRPRDMEVVADVVESRGVTLIALREGITLAPASAELRAFRAAAAWGELLHPLTLSAAIRAGMAAKRAKGGRYCNHLGYGRMWAGPRGREVLLDDPDEQQVISQIREWRDAGYTVEVIYLHLRRLGVLTRVGNEWSRDRIRRVARMNGWPSAGQQAATEKEDTAVSTTA